MKKIFSFASGRRTRDEDVSTSPRSFRWNVPLSLYHSATKTTTSPTTITNPPAASAAWLPAPPPTRAVSIPAIAAIPLPKEMEMDKVLLKTTQLAQKDGLTTKSVRLLKIIDGPGYSEQPIKMVITGPMAKGFCVG
jgi:hypothetical protein